MEKIEIYLEARRKFFAVTEKGRHSAWANRFLSVVRDWTSVGQKLEDTFANRVWVVAQVAHRAWKPAEVRVLRDFPTEAENFAGWAIWYHEIGEKEGLAKLRRERSGRPAYEWEIPFGKFKGQRFAEIEPLALSRYVAWIDRIDRQGDRAGPALALFRAKYKQYRDRCVDIEIEVVEVGD